MQRVGIICAGTTLPAWQTRCLEHLMAIPDVELTLLVADGGDHHAPMMPESKQSSTRTTLWSTYASRFLHWRAVALRPVDCSHLLVRTSMQRCRLVPGRGGMWRISGEDVEELTRLELDAILHLGHGRLEGEILRLSPHGVWALHHLEGGELASGLGCFWAVFRGARVIEAVLQRLTDDGDVTLHEGAFRGNPSSFSGTLDEILLGAAHWPARVCSAILAGAGTEREAPSKQDLVPAPRVPTNAELGRFIATLALRAAKSSFTRLLFSDQWNVGIADVPIESFLEPGARPSIRWLGSPSVHHFVADPFGVIDGDDLIVLVEALRYRTNRGYIAVLDHRGGTASRTGAVIESVGHMSYPFLLEYEGATYCIPETADTGEVRLYRASSFPHRWEHCATLLPDFPAVDATVVRHGERWWLFCTAKGSVPYAAQTTLYAWYAPSLFGPWSPHVLNPLKTDVRSARPAGTPFVHAGRLYRPAQDCSRVYGGSITINEVLTLTPMAFAEQPVAVVKPDAAGPYPNGLHTLSRCGSMTLIDGKRRRIIPPASWRKVRTLVASVATRMPLLTQASPGQRTATSSQSDEATTTQERT